MIASPQSTQHNRRDRRDGWNCLKLPRNGGWIVLAVLLAFGFAFELIARLNAEILWFQELTYLPAFLVRFWTQLGLWGFVTLTSLGLLWGNLGLAERLKWQTPPKQQKSTELTSAYPRKPRPINPPLATVSVAHPHLARSQFPMGLRVLSPLVLGLCGLVGFILVRDVQVALNAWQPNFQLPEVTPPLPSPFDISAVVAALPQKIVGPESLLSWSVGSVIAIAVLLLVNVKICLRAIAVGMSFLFGFIVSGNWTRVLLYFHAVNFHRSDPIFHQDISFYIYKLPLWQLTYFWLGGLSLYALIACILTYLLSGNSFSQGKFPGFSPQQLRHLSGLGSAAMAMQALHHWLGRYELLYSTRGAVYGIGYTDFYIQRPVEIGLFFLASAIASWLCLRMLGTQPERIFPKPQLRGVIGFYLSLFVVAGIVLPAMVQSLGVQPNELARETPFLRSSIAATRAAFDLERNNIEVKTFDPQAQLTPAKLEENELTIDNIRLWDTRPLLESIRQLQQIRLYYSFPSADVDRYIMQLDPNSPPSKQQVIIAARELDYSAVPDEAKTWVNKHLTYTHGYGFTVSPVNKVGVGGLPDYFVQDIGTAEQEGRLLTSNPLVRESIPIENPRLYYGELTNNYIMTPSKVPELDFPSGNENVYTTYTGRGGIPLGNFWRRILFAEYLKDWQMLFTQNFRPDTRLLFRRDINRRLRAIAPFLRYDLDPYLVSVDTHSEASPSQSNPNYLYWVIDAYTTSDRYPYSDPGDYPFNYTRNAVKVVLDAYNGNVNFYVAEPGDPLIQSWQQVFPEMFKPLSAMPKSLQDHLRYPADLLKVQSERLLAYHMTDPTVFYNREDQWQIPQEIYGAEPQPVEPYHLIMRLPTETQEEFILLQPFTPVARPNLIAWLAARSDGENYGKLLLYQFPKQKLVYGIGQIEALINQDPVISQLISLWDTQGSKAIQGNLLVIPIEQSLLYVEPLYLEAEQDGLPILARVIVAYDDNIVIAETLTQAFEKLFSKQRGEDESVELPSPTPETLETPAILRSLDELAR